LVDSLELFRENSKRLDRWEEAVVGEVLENRWDISFGTGKESS